MVSDSQRRDLHALERQLGTGPAGTLMELLPPVGWADVARQSDLVAIRGDMAELRGEMAELRAELRGEMAGLRAELKGEMAELRGELAHLRGEIVRLDAKIDGQFAKLVTANIASMLGVAGLVLATARLV
jgi:ribosomal protein L29